MLLLNGSVWFPATRAPRLLNDMEAHGADVVSEQIFGEALIAGGAARRKFPILGSYMMMFKKAALQHPAFLKFWSGYKMNSNKEITLRRGERGLSDALFMSGLNCSGVYSQAKFEAAVRHLDGSALSRCLEDLVILDPARRGQRKRLLECGTGEDMRNMIVDVSKSKNFLGSSPWLSVSAIGVEVVKKNNEMLYRLARRNLAEWAAGDAEAPFDAVVREELLVSSPLFRCH